MPSDSGRRGLGRAVLALMLLVGIAVGARVIWWLLTPLLPVLFSLAFVLGVFWVVFRRR